MTAEPAGTDWTRSCIRSERRRTTLTHPGPNPPKLPTERPGPKGGKRDRNRRERTASLLHAALDNFLQHGVENTSVDTIAKAAGVAKGSFYRYFSDKTQLVSALLQPVRDALERAFETCHHDLSSSSDESQVFASYTTLGLALAAIFEEHPRTVALYLQECRAPNTGARAPIVDLADRILHHAIALTELALAHHLIRPIDPHVSSLAVIGASERLLLARLQDQLPLPDHMVLLQLVGLVLAGLHPEPEPADSPSFSAS